MVGAKLLPCDCLELQLTACERDRAIELLQAVELETQKCSGPQCGKTLKKFKRGTGSFHGNLPIIFHRFPVPETCLISS